MQAENDDIGLRHQRLLGGRVFAQGGVDAQQLDACHGLQAIANLQAGGASFAVDEYAVRLFHGGA